MLQNCAYRACETEACLFHFMSIPLRYIYNSNISKYHLSLHNSSNHNANGSGPIGESLSATTATSSSPHTPTSFSSSFFPGPPSTTNNLDARCSFPLSLPPFFMRGRAPNKATVALAPALSAVTNLARPPSPPSPLPRTMHRCLPSHLSQK